MNFLLRSIIKTAVLPVALFLAIGTAERASAAVLLTVDVTDPSAVIITGTGAFAGAALTGSSFIGVSLLNMFAPTLHASIDSAATSTTLVAGATSIDLNSFYIPTNGTFLNLYNVGFSPDLAFSTSASAFTGTMVLDLSLLSSLLPVAGAFGSVALGDGTSLFSNPIGTWEVIGSNASVPLPAGGVMLLTAAGALIGLRRRRG